MMRQLFSDKNGIEIEHAWWVVSLLGLLLVATFTARLVLGNDLGVWLSFFRELPELTSSGSFTTDLVAEMIVSGINLAIAIFGAVMFFCARHRIHVSFGKVQGIASHNPFTPPKQTIWSTRVANMRLHRKIATVSNEKCYQKVFG